MKIKESAILEMIGQIEELLKEIKSKEKEYAYLIKGMDSIYRRSARNLIHYHTLRKHDIRGLQKKLKNLGLSRFARANNHVRASLLNNKYILESLIGQPPVKQKKAGLSIKNGEKMQNKFAKELLGFRSKGRRVRIMVTQPSEAADDYQIVHDMVSRGMNCARVNCAHDDPETWLKIIKKVNKASNALGKKVKIAMDLAGPKIRTGEIVPGPQVVKVTPERDHVGRVTNPAIIKLVDEPRIEFSHEVELNSFPVEPGWLKKLKIGDEIKLKDTRGKNRSHKVVAVEENAVLVSCNDTTYMGTGTEIEVEGKGASVIGDIPPVEQYLWLRTNDILTITKSGIGEPAVFDEEGNVIQNAHISCQIPEVFEHVKKGEPILFDDGKIEGKIVDVREDAFDVRIIRAKDPGAKLKAEKGINFPTSDLQISGLTSKDKEDLAFVVEHADIINFSFVNSKQDVEELHQELDKLNARNNINVILKIETQRAFDNLTEILLTAMKMRYIGVMIARGDLAVETGWDKIGWVQKEILGLCNAAHVPVVWATQVFENLAKKGLPSRAEITDATTSLKADCVMLNKGVYINNAIWLLNKILGEMENYDVKSEAMLPRLSKLIK